MSFATRLQEYRKCARQILELSAEERVCRPFRISAEDMLEVLDHVAEQVEERARESRFSTRECDAETITGLGGPRVASAVAAPLGSWYRKWLGRLLHQRRGFIDRLPRVLTNKINPFRPARFRRFLASIPILIICTALAESITSGKAGAQFPVLIVDTAVRNRLAEEWEPTNRYQHERGYCAFFTAEYAFSWTGPVVVYELTSIARAQEVETTGSSIGKMICPTTDSPWVFLHTHPPTQCHSADDTSCELGGPYANQCYPSGTDMRTLNRSDKPFGLIQCDRSAITPFWRTAPLPLADSSSSTGLHR